MDLTFSTMKFIVSINQEKTLKWGLTMSEAFVFAWLYELPSWADKITIKGNDYFFASKNKACEELPAVTQKTDTMYRLYKLLEKKGLIKTEKIGGNDYVMLTAKGKTWYSIDYDTNSENNPSCGKKSEKTEKNPRKLGKKSEKTEKNPRKLGKKSENDSEKNPTNKYINIYNKYQDKEEDDEEEKTSDIIDENKTDFYNKSYPLATISEWLGNEKKWQGAVAQSLQISIDDVKSQIPLFIAHLRANGCTRKCGGDVKPHFTNWIRRKLKEIKNENNSTNQTARAGERNATDEDMLQWANAVIYGSSGE